MRDWHKMLVAPAIGWVLASSPAFAQQQPKLRPLRIALPSNTITPGATKFEFDIDQRDMGLKEPPKPEQVFDFSLLDEVVKR